MLTINWYDPISETFGVSYNDPERDGFHNVVTRDYLRKEGMTEDQIRQAILNCVKPVGRTPGRRRIPLGE